MAQKTVLLVDDDFYVREVVQACLRDLNGWVVISASSVQEGLKNLSEEHYPDAILLDIVMPGMDGITFINRLRKSSLKQTIPIILLTAKARWFTPQQLHQWGVVEAIAKPFNPITLAQEITKILQWDIEECILGR